MKTVINMRVRQLKLSDINYTYTVYREALYDSVKRIGFSVPVKVRQTESGMVCVDGHKRLSILHDLLEADPHYQRGDLVPVIIVNQDDIRSNDCSRGRNSH